MAQTDSGDGQGLFSGTHSQDFSVIEVIKQKQKAEQREIAGWHKNSGPKDHKGAR